MEAKRLATTKQSFSSLEDEPAVLRKKIAKYNEFYSDLQKEHESAEEELISIQNELRSLRKNLDEAKIDADMAIKGKNDVEIQYKHVLELKKEQEKEIRLLENKQADIESALDAIGIAEEKWAKQKNMSISEFERQKNLIQIQSRFLGRKLEDDRRHLQSKFFEAKQELKRNFRREVDQLKQHQALELTDFERDSKTEISKVKEKFQKKISKLESDNYSMRTKIDLVNQTLVKLEDEIKRLQKGLQRETTNSEVMGITSIEWLDPEQRETFMNEFLTSKEKTLDRMTQQMRDKLIAAEEDLLLSKRRRTAADRQVKELRHDLVDQAHLFKKLESSKNDIERRLTKRIEQLEEQIKRKNRHTEADHTIAQNKLVGNKEDKDEMLIALKKELDEIQFKLKTYKISTSKMSEKVGDKLDFERERFAQLEKEKHELTSEVLHYKREIGDVKEHISTYEKEVARYKTQVSTLIGEKEKLLDKTQNIEQSVRRLESAPIKA